MESEIGELMCKIIIVGDSGVGKTTLMNTFCKGTYNPHLATVAVNFESKCIQIFDKTIKLMIWDTAGQEKYCSIIKCYFRQIMGVLFVYDVTCPETLLNMEKWFNIVNEEAPDNIVKILVGNKCDDENSKLISLSEGKAVADHFGLLFFEASSKENVNVDTIFYLIGSKILDLHKNGQFPQPNDGFTLTNEENNSKDDSNCWLSSIYNWFKF